MSKSIPAKINPSILRWARESLGLQIPSAAKKIGIKPERLAACEKGEGQFTIANLKKAAVAYKRPPAIFFLARVPEDLKPIADFRRLPESLGNPLSPEARLQVRRIYEKQRAAIQMAAPSSHSEWNFLDSYAFDDDPESIGNLIRSKLGGNFELPWSSQYAAFNSWRNAIESFGVLVFLISGVSKSEFGGFSITDRLYPVIALNRRDRPPRRTFSLIHEFCHLMLGQPGICDINDADYRNTEDHLKVEVFCNHAAGAALVPQEKLLSSNFVRSHGSSPNWAYPELIHLANSFMVNQEVVLRRLLLFGKTTSNFYDYWRKKIGEYETVTKPKGSPREKAFLKALRTQGEGYVRLVLNALHNNTITVSRASDYLDLKVQHFSELEAAVE